MHAVPTCYMLLLYASVVMVIMYRGVFTIGIAMIRTESGIGANTITSARALTDYSYISARDSDVSSGVQIARCVTGVGPSATEDNSDLGGVYFNGNRLPFETCGGSSRLVHPRAAGLGNPGVINVIQCSTPFTTDVEGIYTCTMMNSSMMNESVSFGVYFNIRSELLYLYITSLNHFYVSTQLLQW